MDRCPPIAGLMMGKAATEGTFLYILKDQFSKASITPFSVLTPQKKEYDAQYRP